MSKKKNNTLRKIGARGQSVIDAARGKKRTGPFSPESYSLIKDIRRLRESLEAVEDTATREFLLFTMGNANRTYSQIFQDVFVLFALKQKTNGYFCEFGATDGKTLSNSCLLEESHGWTGICAEPALGWHHLLRKNRPNALIDTRCVWSKTGETLTFRQTEVKELSTVESFASGDQHSRYRQGGSSYEVKTISLNDLLNEYNAPKSFDYLSMDTEGSELQIIEAHDFNLHRPKVITVEHNFTPNRTAIHQLLTQVGYKRVLVEVSQFDDWYVDTSAETYFSA